MWGSKGSGGQQPDNFRSSNRNIEFLETAYKDAQLEAKLASDISKALLEKNEQNERIIADLREMDEMKNEKIEQLEHQCAEYEHKIEEIQQQFADLSATTETLRKSLVESKMEYKELHQKYLDYNAMKAENEKLLRQLEAQSVELEQRKLQEASQQKLVSKYMEEKDQLQLRFNQLEQKVFQLDEDCKTYQQKLRQADRLHLEVEETSQKLLERDGIVQTLRKEKESLEVMLCQLSRRLSSSQSPNRSEENKGQLSGSSLPIEPSSEPNGEASIDHQPQSSPLVTEQPQSPDTKPQDDSDDQSRTSFFFLSVTAIRTGLITRSPELRDVLLQVDIEPLYQEAIKENISFHGWYPWLESRLERIVSAKTGSSLSPSENEGATSTTQKRDIGNGAVGLRGDSLKVQLAEAERKSKQQIEELRAALEDANREKHLHEMQQEMLKREIRALDRLTKREQHINYEYLRNVVLEYLASNQASQQATLANVLVTLLACSPAELERIRASSGKKLNMSSSATPTSSPQPSGGLLSRVFGGGGGK